MFATMLLSITSVARIVVAVDIGDEESMPGRVKRECCLLVTFGKYTTDVVDSQYEPDLPKPLTQPNIAKLLKTIWCKCLCCKWIPLRSVMTLCQISSNIVTLGSSGSALGCSLGTFDNIGGIMIEPVAWKMSSTIKLWRNLS